MPPGQVVAATRELAGRDPVVARLVDEHGVPALGRSVPGPLRFAELARAIVYQQLAGKAAAAIHGRLVGVLGGEVTAERVLACAPAELAGCGLSAAKVKALWDLAQKVWEGAVSLERIGRLDDEGVVQHLVQVHGIGRWTAEMFLMFSLGRLDVWPVGDLGVRAGYAAAWGEDARPAPAELAVIGDCYRPYRSIVAWYCWRAVEA